MSVVQKFMEGHISSGELYTSPSLVLWGLTSYCTVLKLLITVLLFSKSTSQPLYGVGTRPWRWAPKVLALESFDHQ